MFRFDLSGISARAHRDLSLAHLALLPSGTSTDRVIATANIVAAQAIDAPESALQGAAQARSMALELGDPLANAYALVARGLSDHSPDSVRSRLSDARKILAVARNGTGPELATVGHYLLLTSLLEQGDIRSVDIELSPHGESAIAFPFLLDSRHTQWFRCLRAILDGRTGEAEALANSILATAAPDDEAASRSVWAAHIGTIRWMQGRIDEMESAFLSARHAFPHEQLWEFSLAWLWQVQGRTSAAQTLLDAFPDLDTIPRDRNFLVTMTILGEIASLGGDRSRAELMRDTLLPYAHHAVPVGLGLGFWGTVARTLGMLCRSLGRNDEARAHFRTAIEVSARSGAQAWLAEAQLELADHEIAIGGNLNEAADLAQQAASASRSLGFPSLSARAQATLSALPDDPPTSPASLSDPRAVAVQARVCVLGRFDVTAHTGEVAEWKSRKARDLLKMLVARRGVVTSREVFMQALWPDIRPEALANRFAVAVSTVRRALDPQRCCPVQQFVVMDGQGVQLNLDNLWVDVEESLVLVRRSDTESLRTVVRVGVGEAFADEPYADWAFALRAEAQTAFCAAARMLAQRESDAGDHLSASELHRRVLEIEPFDQAAHEGLVDALTALGAHEQAQMTTHRRERLMDDLGR